jgi:hypothetical protein
VTDPDKDVLDRPDERMRRTYAAVVLVEIAVVAALWWLGRVFAS